MRRVVCNSILLSNFANQIIYKRNETTKIFALALTLLMGISLTSCFNDEDDPIVKMSLLARYDGGYYGASFTTVDGVRLIPADQSVMLTLTEGLYSIYFQYNRDEVPEGAKEITITLLSDPARLDRLYTTPEMGTGVSNAPLYALSILTILVMVRLWFARCFMIRLLWFIRQCSGVLLLPMMMLMKKNWLNISLQ